MNDWTTFVSNVGFPIAAFCAMWYMCNTTLKENTSAINRCTDLIQRLIDKKEL